MRRAIGTVLGAALALAPSPSIANPNSGEARSLLKDPDRVYTVVAGEGDGASTVTNPANLGFLRGVNGIVDIAWTSARARMRGSGVGALIGIPLPFRIASLGFAYQFLYPVQPEGAFGEDNAPESSDTWYSKVTFALAVPLMRWVRGVSVGVNYSRLAGAHNFHAHHVNQVDLGISWWPTRFLALGLVGRGLNVPRTGPERSATQPLVIDPEIALRPLGTPALEIAFGGRIAPVPGNPDLARFRVPYFEPRGRLMVGIRGARVFATAEQFRYYPDSATSLDLEPVNGVRILAGVQLDFGHIGFAGAPMLAAGGERSFAAVGGAARVRLSQERYDGVLVVQPRRVTRIDMTEFGGERGTWKLVELIDELAAKRATVLVETRGMKNGWAQTEEIREALLRLRKRGGKVAAYMEGGGLRPYFLATAADRIIVHPNEGLSILGMRIQAFYFGELLGKLGAKAEFVRIAEYKSATETYERAGPSGPAAHQRKLLYSDVWNHVLRTIARDRGQDPLVVKQWIDEATQSTEYAIREGMVDDVAWPDELDVELEDWLDHKVRIEKPDVRKEHTHQFGKQPRIAVVLIEGDLIDGESFTIPLLGRKLAGSKTLTEEIEKLRKDPGVRAVVVRLDTPGGSVSASDAIARKLDLVRKEKPVVISMGNACASGGYYIATAGQYMFADAATITGSIGIFYPKVDLSGLLDKLGVGSWQVEYGRRAGLRSWWKPYDADDREAAFRDIRRGYEVFTTRVGTARSMTTEQVDRVARGRVWSGVRALEVGLVDDYGGLREAVLRARAIAGLRADEGDVVLLPEPPGLLENLRTLFNVRIPLPLGDASARRGGWEMAILAPIVRVLRHIPVNLWLAEGPEPLALMEESIAIED